MCLAFAAALFLILQFIERPPEPYGDLGGQYIRLSGRVYQKEIKNDKSVIYLNHVYGDSNSPHSKLFINLQQNNRKVMCYIQGEFPEIGSVVSVEGKVRLFEAATNPGEFDAGEYYQILGIAFQMQEAEIYQKSEEFDWHKEGLYQCREKLWKILKDCLPEKEAGILGAMLLGRKESLDSGVKDLYQRYGISHILAISGLHITLLGMGFYKGLRRVSVPIPAAAVLGILFMYEYGQMTGFGTSTARAVMMFTLHLTGRLLGRTYDLITAAALACVLLLCSSPLYLYHSGFLLSFGAVMGIGLMNQPLQELNPWNREKGLYPALLGQAFLSGLAIQLATLPILLCTFYEYPVYSIILNLIVVPLMSILFLDGLLGLAAGAFWRAAGTLLLWPGRIILTVYELLANMSGRLPGSRIITGKPEAWQVILYYLLLICALYLAAGQKRRKRAYCTGILVLCLVCLCGRYGNFQNVAMLDIGQGDACVIQTGRNRAVFIDGGSSSKKNIAQYQMIPYLKYSGIDTVECMFITHMDADHVNGLIQLMELSREEGIKLGCLAVSKYTVKDEAYYQTVQLAADRGMSVIELEKGDVLRFRQTSFECIYPLEESSDGDRNNASLILKVQIGKWNGIFMGDLGEEKEMEVIAGLNGLEGCDMLKVGHHGSNTSSSEELLQTLKPETAFISCGRKNSYGHPGRETLERLEAAGSRVFVTAEKGALRMRILKGGERMEISCFGKNVQIVSGKVHRP